MHWAEVRLGLWREAFYALGRIYVRPLAGGILGIGQKLGQAFAERHFMHWAGFMLGIRRKAFYALGRIYVRHSPKGIFVGQAGAGAGGFPWVVAGFRGRLADGFS